MALPMHYETSYEWEGGMQENGALTIEGKHTIAVGHPQDTERLSPEHMLLAAAEVCLLNTLVAISTASKLEILGYGSKASAELEFVPKEGYRFKSITIHPSVAVAEKDLDKARRILERAHSACLIARSLSCPVEMEAEFETR